MMLFRCGLCALTVFLRICCRSPSAWKGLFEILAVSGRTIPLIRIKRSRFASFSVNCCLCLNRCSASSVIGFTAIEGETVYGEFDDQRADEADASACFLRQKYLSSRTRKRIAPSIPVIMMMPKPMLNFILCWSFSQVFVSPFSFQEYFTVLFSSEQSKNSSHSFASLLNHSSPSLQVSTMHYFVIGSMT